MHQDEYRAAFEAGAGPGPQGHSPSQFKLAGHPNRFVDGQDTATGLPSQTNGIIQQLGRGVPLEPNARIGLLENVKQFMFEESKKVSLE